MENDEYDALVIGGGISGLTADYGGVCVADRVRRAVKVSGESKRGV